MPQKTSKPALFVTILRVFAYSNWFLPQIKTSRIYIVMRLFYANKKLKAICSFLFCILCIAFVVFSPTYIFDKERYSLSLNKYLSSMQTKDVVLSLYHVETFEGGTASRSKYLEKMAQRFNRLYSNCYIVVKTISQDELVLNIEKDNIPDMLSFGTGAGEYIAGFMAELEKNKNVRSDLATLGTKGGKILAYPYMLSGYALISKQSLDEGENDISKLLEPNKNSKKTIKGVSIGMENTNPCKVLAQKGIKSSKENAGVFDSQYDAYCSFVRGESVSLLGTARDVHRIKNREQNGTIPTCSYYYFGSYSDLVQYIGVSTKSIKNLEYCKLFATFLTQEESQQAIKNYGLFSVRDTKIYTENYMNEFEDVLMGHISSFSAFSSLSDIKSIQKVTFDAIFE